MSRKYLPVFLSICLLWAGCSFWREPTRAEIEAVQSKIAEKPQDDVWNITRRFYEDRQFRPVWIARGRTLPRLQQFFQVVDDRSHGLHPEDFGIDAVRVKSADPIDFDIRVTHTLIEYLSALAFGRIDPADIDRNWIGIKRQIDIKQVLADAIASESIASLPAAVAPKHADYARLRTALLTAASDEQRRQIALNLDRWRWLPDDLGSVHVRVNIPSFALQVHDGRQMPLSMKVVVGTNEDRTPIFSSEMKHVVFSPYWNIPESIITKETLPKIMKDPDYVARQNIEVVRGDRVIDPQDVDWENVNGSDIQLRQKPGVKNSLGLVKFMFPNKFNVYLHDTPSDNLFDRLTRNFSHGCVRVEQPVELASFLLRDQPEWTGARIQSAMHAEQERHVKLKDPVPVHIVYFTAWADETGMIHFEKDVYGYDARQLDLTTGDRSH